MKQNDLCLLTLLVVLTFNGCTCCGVLPLLFPNSTTEFDDEGMYDVTNVTDITDDDTSWNISNGSGEDLFTLLGFGSQSDVENDGNSSCVGEGFFTAANNCYYFVEKDFLTPKQYHDVCGEDTFKLRNKEEWDLFQNAAVNAIFFDILDVGFTSFSSPSSTLYDGSGKWADGTIAYFMPPHNDFQSDTVWDCGYLHLDLHLTFVTVACDLYGHNSPYNRFLGVLCQRAPSNPTRTPVKLQPPSVSLPNTNFVTCPSNHSTHDFLACDVDSACWSRGLASPVLCAAPMTPLPPFMTCDDKTDTVPYSLVCDLRRDCFDGSDEKFCRYSDVETAFTFVRRGDQECARRGHSCDAAVHCIEVPGDGVRPLANVGTWGIFFSFNTPPPAVVQFTEYNSFVIEPISLAQYTGRPLCPETHFQCPDNGYCLPVFVRCNGVFDCPGHEDEADCQEYTCLGFYRCRASNVCLHPGHVCDGKGQCPQDDDELFCALPMCPDGCTCYGHSLFCTKPSRVDTFPNLRYLEAAGSGMKPTDVQANVMLVYLSLARCALTDHGMLTLPNLRFLDLRDNHIQEVRWKDLSVLKNLRVLSLAGNPIVSMLSKDVAIDFALSSLHGLDVSRVPMAALNTTFLSVLPQLRHLNLSSTGIDLVLEDGFQRLAELRVLDVSGCPVTVFPPDMLTGVDRLQTIYADNYKLCCPATLPADFNPINCHALASDSVSSCEALVRSDVYRMFLLLFAALAFMGNVISLVFRMLFSRSRSRIGFSVFVTHLSMSDLLMGVYMAVIGVADRLYHGTYYIHDTAWRRSPACAAAGFLSLVSSEVSAFLICLITLDRFLVLRFPFSSLHFSRRSALVASLGAWVLGIAVASVPLLPAFSHWRFYSQTAICITLPISRAQFQGHGYSFGVLVVLNFVLFLLIAGGQASIYLSVRANRMGGVCQDTRQRSKELTIARRLITVAMSDFLCWFPIGVLGLHATSGHPVPPEISVAMAIIVLPLNSALNPFLYTVNTIVERRREAHEEQLQKRVLKQLKAEEEAQYSNSSS